MAGYSGTPLVKKLGIRSGSRIFPAGAPLDYAKLVGPLPSDAVLMSRVTRDTDIVHLFCTKKIELAKSLGALRNKLRDDGAIWVSWPKKASKVPTDVTEDTVRELALPLGFVDIKVCAVDEVWSGLKLVVRRDNRTKA